MKLFHTTTERIGERILKEGLIPQNTWEDINEYLPQRPKGIFLWGVDNKDAFKEFTVSVDVNSLNIDNLYAFPAKASTIADLLSCGYKLKPEVIEYMRNARPVKFSEFKNEFLAEYIYTGDINPDLLRKE